MTTITLDNPHVKPWIKGQRIIVSANNKFGELFILTESEHKPKHYSFFRCFSLGEDVAVSCDHQTDSLEEMSIKLVAFIGTLR